LTAQKLASEELRVNKYKCFWTDDHETLKNQREYLRKRAEHTGKIEDVQAWRRQAAILRTEITESKRKSFNKFYIPYQLPERQPENL